MEDSASDSDSTDKDTDGIDSSYSHSLEDFTMNNEELNANVRRKIRMAVSQFIMIMLQEDL
jgi:hypothetical protein